MPAFPDEIEMALAEGVELWELQTPVKISSQNGDLNITLQQMQVTSEDKQGRARIKPAPTKKKEILVQHLFTAIGASTAEPWYDPPKKGTDILQLSNSTLVYQSGRPVLVWPLGNRLPWP